MILDLKNAFKSTQVFTLANLVLPVVSSLALGSLLSCTTTRSSQNTSVFENNYKSSNLSSSNTSLRGPSASEESPQVAEDMTLDWPVDSARMTRGFLPNKRKPHLGIDLAAPRGTPILAAMSGTVIYAGREFRGYGKMVLIESGEGWATLYAHFDKILISEGQRVRKGEVIGAMGRTGHATGVHLHFELRQNHGPIDPLPLLPRIATARR
jgi:murein DD-endopeptidase MepM/ murein hydrolase activator NlpD